MLTCTEEIPVIISASMIACPVDSSVKNTDLISPFSERQALHILFISNTLGSILTSIAGKLNYITNINTTKDAQTRKANGENRFFHWSIVSNKAYSTKLDLTSANFGTHKAVASFKNTLNFFRNIYFNEWTKICILGEYNEKRVL